MKYKPLLLATMSSEEQPVSISEAPMSSDEGKSELEQYWCEFVERALPGTTLVRVDVLFNGRGRVTVRYVPPWDKKLIGSFMDAANALVEYCICRVEVDTSKLRFEYICCDDTTIRPSVIWDSSKLEPAVDPGRAMKPLIPNKPSLSPLLPDCVKEECEKVQEAERKEFTELQRTVLDFCAHPLQQARMAKDAAEPNSFLRNPLFVAPAATLPDGRPYRGIGRAPDVSLSSSSSAFVHQGMKMAKRQRPGTTVVLWQREPRTV